MNYSLKIGKIYKITDENFEENLSYLPKTRQEYILKFKNKTRQKQSLVATLLLEECLKELNVLDEYHKLAEGKNGQWVLKDSPVHFSVSHCDDTVMVVASFYPIGCDIEKVRKIGLDVAEKFFLESEIANIKTSSHPELAFFSYWTIKESYLKLIGKGLSEPLSSVEVDESLTSIKNHPECVVESCFLNDCVMSVVYKKN